MLEFISCRNLSGSLVWERMGFNHWWYKMDRKKSYSPKTQDNLWATNASFINHREKEENTAKAAKNSQEYWGISWRRPAKHQKLWNLNLQQFNKDWAKQKDLSELFTVAGRRMLPQEGLQVTTLGEGLGQDYSQAYPSLLKYQHTAHGCYTQGVTEVNCKGRINPPACGIWAGQHQVFFFVQL